jgi:uncharacterized protein (DUF1015 family)
VAGINSFKGLRYNSQQFGQLATFFAPPYDVIDADMRTELIAGNPRNIAAVTRSPEAEQESEENRYSHASSLLSSWKQEGALCAEESECLYVYEQEFSVGDNIYKRLGLVAGLELVEFGQGVHPHEETLSGAKADRRLLLEQTRTHLGQIFGLYPDETGSVNAILGKVTSGSEPADQATDSDEIIHRIWVLSDEAIIAELQKLMKDKDVFIADGHHRYETALKYSREHPELPVAANVMATLVALSDPGLVVLPTHRLVHSLKDFNAAELENSLEDNFRLEKLAFPVEHRSQQLEVLLERMAAIRKEGLCALGLYAGGDHLTLLVLENNQAMTQAAPEKGDDFRRLDVAILHSLILEKLLGIDKAKLAAKSNLDYLKDTGAAIEDAVATIDAGKAQCVFIMNSTAVSEVSAVALNGEKMPQKSTFFHPKIFTGMVIMPLAD